MDKRQIRRERREQGRMIVGSRELCKLAVSAMRSASGLGELEVSIRALIGARHRDAGGKDVTA